MEAKRTRTVESPYMHWAKLESGATYNLATSGMPNVSLRDLPFEKEDLEMTYGAYGYEPLIEEIAGRCSVSPENVVLSFGTSMANHLAMAAMISPGEQVLIEMPTYELIVSAAEFLGAEVDFFSRSHANAYDVDIDELRARITDRTTLIILTNLHNPSSVYLCPDRLAAIGDAAARVGARVLVDEVYLATMFGEAPRSSFHLGDNFVVTSSLTKAYGLSGLRCGWILADKALARKMHRLNDLFGSTNVHVAERLSLIALKHLHIFRERSERLLRENRPLLNEFLRSRADLDTVIPTYGTTAFPKLIGKNADDLVKLLREKYETSVVPGSFFYEPDHFRVGISCDTDTLREGLERLASALDEL